MRLFLFLLAAPLAFAQSERISFGLTGGGALTRPTSKNPFVPDESRRYILGPDVRFALTENVSLRFNPLYRRLGQTLGGVLGEVPLRPNEEFIGGVTRLRGNTIELPVLGQYHFGGANRKWRPFAGAGFSFQRTFGQRQKNAFQVRNTETGSIQTAESYPARPSVSEVGAVFATGIEFKWKRLRYSPEFRYSLWPGSTPAPFRASRGQFDALFSIRF